MTQDDLDPQDAPEFDRDFGGDDLVSDSEYGDQGYHPERSTMDGGQVPVDNLHEALLEAERALSELNEQLSDTLTLNRSLTELRATADAYARLDSEHHNGGD